MPRLRRRIAMILAVALTAAGLAACTPTSGSSGGSGSVDDDFAKVGIATVHFAGGKPEQPVTGHTVLVLTDWQMRAVSASAPTAGSTRHAVPGTSLSSLDAAVAATAPTGDAAKITPSALIQAWWASATTARAKLARAAYPHPIATAPYYVLTLFLADSLDDLGRSGASAHPTATGTGLAGGGASVMPRGPLAAPDPCGAVSGLIDDVNGFLDSAGTLGTVLKGVVGTIIDVAQTAAGPVLKAVKLALAIANVVLNAATLLSTWKPDVTVTPGGPFSVALNGAAGGAGTVKVSLSNGLGSLPVGVSKCLDLFGLDDPTSLKGSAVTWQDMDSAIVVVTDDGITTVTSRPLVPADNEAAALDDQNTARWTFTAGAETLSGDGIEPASPDHDAWLGFSVARSDLPHLTDWIHGIAAQAGGLLPQVDQLADALTTIAGSIDGSIDLPVRYFTTKKQEKKNDLGGDPPGDTGGIHDVADPGCLPPSVIGYITGTKIIAHFRGGGVQDQPACAYEISVKDGTGFGYIPPYAVPSDLGVGFQAILTGTYCSGPSDFIPIDTLEAIGTSVESVTAFAIYHDGSLAIVEHFGNPVGPQQSLITLAKGLGYC